MPSKRQTVSIAPLSVPMIRKELTHVLALGLAAALTSSVGLLLTFSRGAIHGCVFAGRSMHAIAKARHVLAFRA